MTFSLAHCELVTLLVTFGQLRPRLAAFDNVCQVQTSATTEGFSLITRSVITAGSDLLAAKPVPNRAMLRGMSTRRRSYSSAIQLAEVRH